MKEKTYIDGKVIEPYPVYLAPLARSFETIGDFSDNSVLDTYDLIIEELLEKGFYKKSGELVITKIKEPFPRSLKKFIDKVEEDRFIIPASLRSLPEDVVVPFLKKILDWIGESWTLLENNKLHPSLNGLTSKYHTIAFIPPSVKDFNGAKPETVLAMFNLLQGNPVFDSSDSLNTRTADKLSALGVKQTEIDKSIVESGLKGLEKYFTVTPVNSLKTMKLIAKNTAQFNYGALGAVTLGLPSVLFFVTPEIGITASIASGVFWLATGIYSGVVRDDPRIVVTLTKEGQLLHSQLLAWDRYRKQVETNARYGRNDNTFSDEPIKVPRRKRLFSL